MHYLNDATIHIDQQALSSGLSHNLKQLETAFAEDKSVGFTQDNGTLLSLRFTDADAESDTLLKLLAAPKPPSMLLSEQKVIRAWFVLAEPCDKSSWQTLGQTLEQTLGGIFELADTVQPLPGVNSTVLYQREVPYTLAELQRVYPARNAPKATPESQDGLRDAIQATDLPALVAHHYLESGAKPATCGVVKAVWRGDENPSLSLFQVDDGTWLYRDHGTNEAGNSFGFLVDILGISKQAAAEAIKAGTFTSLTLPPAQTPAVPAKPKKKKPHVRSQIVKTYAYHDENYHLQYEVVRFHPKRFDLTP